MKRILLSADSAIRVYSVPDEVAEHLEAYCMEFCCHWLWESPDAERYRVPMGGTVVLCYTEKDFIAWLNQYACAAPSVWIETLADDYDADHLPDEYAGLPYFNF